MKLVILESPYAGEIDENVKYARKCMIDSIYRGESPIVSHLLYTQVLIDTIPKERELGIRCGFAWRFKCDYVVFYVDKGWSNGMLSAKELYEKENIPFRIRKLNKQVL